MLGTVMATCSILQSVIKYAKPAVSIYPVVKNNWQPTPATNRFFGPTISKAERDKRLHLYVSLGTHAISVRYIVKYYERYW